MEFSVVSQQIKFTFKDGKCPVVLADAQSVLVWVADGVAHVQFYALQINNPQQLQPHTAEVSPVVQVAMPLPVLGGLQEAVNNQFAELEKQGLVKRVTQPETPPTDAGAKH
jgi:hypothetical protein